MAKNYDPNKDYSQAIKDAQASGASQSTIDQLYQERQNKIDAVYGGKEPNMTGSDKTFSQTYGGGSGSSSSSNYSPTTQVNKGPGYVTGGYNTGVFGTPILTENPYYNPSAGVDTKLTADMSRRPDLAGKTATSNGYTVFYDDNGYAVRSRKGSSDYLPTQDWYVSQGTYDGGNLWTDEEMLTPNDLARIQQIRNQLNAGQITGDQANSLANQIRSGYGYTIDKAGNVTDLGVRSAVMNTRNALGMATDMDPYTQNFLNQMFSSNNPGNSLLGMYGSLGGSLNYGGGSGGFDYDSAPEYQSMYAAQMQNLLSQIQNSSFQNWANGSDYQYLKDKYTAAGQDAMQDVLGQVAARTGGYASSYATAAAGQAYNDYMTTLQDAARAMYTDEYNRQVQNLGLMSDMENMLYNQYLNQLSQWNTDRNFAYGAYRDNVADQQWNQQWQYGVGRDQIEDQRYNDQLALNRAETLAAYGDFSGYKDLGYTDAQISAMKSAYQAQLAAATAPRSSGGRSSRGRSGGSSSSKPRLTASQTLSALEGGLRNQQVLDAYEYWYGEPFTDSSASSSSGSGSGKTSLNFNQDEGVFTWNGKQYGSSQALVNDIENANLSESEKSALKKKFNLFGFDIDL